MAKIKFAAISSNVLAAKKRLQEQQSGITTKKVTRNRQLRIIITGIIFSILRTVAILQEVVIDR